MYGGTRPDTLRMLVVGDNAIPTEVFREQLGPLESMGASVRYIQWRAPSLEEFSSWTRKVEQLGPESRDLPGELAEAALVCHILVVHWCPVPRRIVESASDLRVIATARAGLENLASDAILARRIPLIHAVGRNADSVAEYTVGLMLAESRNVARGHELLRRGIWQRTYSNTHSVKDMRGSTVGIIGLGQVGRGVARRLSGFDVRLVGHDPFAEPQVFDTYSVERLSLHDVLKNADYVTIHVRLADDTRGLIGRPELALMKPTAYLINTARAAIVDQDALVEALTLGRIAGAALDVFEQEPLSNSSPLLKLDNVTITPHLAGRTISGYSKGPQIVSKAIFDLIGGRRLDNEILVNPGAITNELERDLRSLCR